MMFCTTPSSGDVKRWYTFDTFGWNGRENLPSLLISAISGACMQLFCIVRRLPCRWHFEYQAGLIWRAPHQEPLSTGAATALATSQSQCPPLRSPNSPTKARLLTDTFVLHAGVQHRHSRVATSHIAHSERTQQNGRCGQL